nr:unnamed protein product [Digitaria exilis]
MAGLRQRHPAPPPLLALASPLALRPLLGLACLPVCLPLAASHPFFARFLTAPSSVSRVASPDAKALAFHFTLDFIFFYGEDACDWQVGIRSMAAGWLAITA